jgi:methylthioribose-1-phosphate isomerase
VANKIGTYALAVLAHAHNIPIDPNIHTGDDIKIEERHRDEVTNHGGSCLAPDGVAVYNPAFDVTPNHLVSCIITESGILRQPYGASLRVIKLPRFSSTSTVRTVRVEGDENPRQNRMQKGEE